MLERLSKKDVSHKRKKQSSEAADTDKRTKRTPTNPFQIANQSEEYFVEEVVARRTTKGGGVEFFVKWVGYDESQNTWEPMSNLAGSETLRIWWQNS